MQISISKHCTVITDIWALMGTYCTVITDIWPPKSPHSTVIADTWLLMSTYCTVITDIWPPMGTHCTVITYLCLERCLDPSNTVRTAIRRCREKLLKFSTTLRVQYPCPSTACSALCTKMMKHSEVWTRHPIVHHSHSMGSSMEPRTPLILTRKSTVLCNMYIIGTDLYRLYEIALYCAICILWEPIYIDYRNCSVWCNIYI